jgi:hypothetical protein
MIKVQLDWGAAREYVEQAEPMKEVVEFIQNDLQEYVNESGMDTVKQYLSTHYFDETGYRYNSLLEDAGTWARNDVLSAMHRITAARIAQERIFGEEEAERAFAQWVLGHHDT